MVTDQFAVDWIDIGRLPRSLPDPDYPNGIDLDISKGRTPACRVALPYPAHRLGYYVVVCHKCGYQVTVTTAGRPDDPRSVTLACLQGVG